MDDKDIDAILFVGGLAVFAHLFMLWVIYCELCDIKKELKKTRKKSDNII